MRTACWPSAPKRARRPGRESHARARLRRLRAVDCAQRSQSQALAAGYAVVDQTSVLATHLAEVIKQHAHELLTRQETKRLLDRLAREPAQAGRRTGAETPEPGRSAEGAAATAARAGFDPRLCRPFSRPCSIPRAANKHPVLLVEAARQALGRALVRPLLGEDGGLRVVTLDRGIEEELGRAFSAQAAPVSNALQPSFVRRILEGLRRLAGEQVA